MRRRATSVVAALVAACLATASLAPHARADGEDLNKGNKAIATDLFDKGVKLMDAGHCEETPTDLAACKAARDDFRRAYELYPGALGALRNLAYVEKGLGLVASAARDFREVARKAPLDPKPERQKWADYANVEVTGLEPRVPHLTVKTPGDHPAGMQVTLDGVSLVAGGWDTPIDVDPGAHRVHAEAPGRLSYDGSVEVAERQSKSIAIYLEPDKTTIGAATTASAGRSRTGPLLVAGLGVIGLGVGLGLGYASMKKKDDACGGASRCDPDGLAQGRSLANASTLVTGIGAAALVGGAVWYLLTPAPKSTDETTAIAPWAAPSAFGVGASGSF